MGLLCAFLVSGHAGAEAPRIDLFFYQPDRAEGLLDPHRMAADLDRAVAAGASGVVVQYLAHGDDELVGPLPDGGDPLGALLDGAQQRGLTVWMGTVEDPSLWRKRSVSIALWRRIAARGLDIARRAALRYGAHPAFAGWYWTPEAVWDRRPGPGRLRELGGVTANALSELRTLTPGRPIAVALGPGGGRGEMVLAKAWCRYAELSRPDVVVLMDGVGSAHLDVARLPDLYGEVRRCLDPKVELWADVELFAPGPDPPAPDRLRAQLGAARQGAASVIAFDLNHHLRPGSVADFVLRSGSLPSPPRILGATLLEPALPQWPGRNLVTVEAPIEVPSRVTSIQAVCDGSPRLVSVAGRRMDGTWVDLGELTPHHGPGRSQQTWIWRALDPEGAGPFGAVRLSLRRSTGGLGPPSIEVYGPDPVLP